MKPAVKKKSRTLAARAQRSAPTIRNLTDLRLHLQVAMQIEHATIPPYFTAWLTIKEGTNFMATQVIRSVMVEEMLHLTLAANLLNAVGGKPQLTQPGFVPRYPHRLPHSGDSFKVSIERFSRDALETFLKIERPETEGAQPQLGEWSTLGQFYAAIRLAIDELCDRLGEQRVFCGDIQRQVQPTDYYGSGGLIVVTDRQSAHQAIDEIVEQGEGAHHGIFDGQRQILGDGDGGELAHYYRYLEVLRGRRFRAQDTPQTGPTGDKLEVDFAAVYPIHPNTRAEDYPAGSETRRGLEAFRDGYGELLAGLEASFNGNPNQLTPAMARMFSLRQQALALVRTPSGRDGMTVGIDFGG